MTATERQIFEPDGRAVPYLDEGAGPVVVLLPAAGLDFAYLGTLGSILVEEDFRVIRIGTRTAQTDAVTLHDLAITPVPRDTSGLLSMEATARTYRYLDAVEVAAQQKAAADKAKAGAKK